MGFGDNVDINNPIRTLLATAPSLCSAEVALLMRDRYETTYGIYNHDANDPERKLALVGMHPKEDTTRHSLLHERVREFTKREVFKHTGINLKDFLELPTDVCGMIFESAAEAAKEVGKMTNEVVDDLKKAAGAT